MPGSCCCCLFCFFCAWCSRGPFLGSTSGIHADLKYSMNWECPATHRPNLCSCRGELITYAKQSGVERWWWGSGGVESCSLSLKDELKPLFHNWSDSPAVFSPAVLKCHAPHPATHSLSSLLLSPPPPPPPPLHLQCISVRKCLRTFHGSEKTKKNSH